MSDSPPRLASVAAILPLAATPPGAAARYPGVAAMLAERLRRDPTRPAITFYDDATGERVELSTATLDNWVAKTANLLVDTLGLAPGDKVAVDLPVHWLTAAVLLATWSAGAEVLVATDTVGALDTAGTADITGDDDHGVSAVVGGKEDKEDADNGVSVAFVAADRVDTALAGAADEVVALSLRPLGARLAYPIAGVLDYAAEVPGHGDHFSPSAPPAEQEAMLSLAARVAAGWGLGPSDRVLSTAAVDTADGLLAGLLAPLAVGASVVLCRHLDASLLPRRIATERVTAVCGLGGLTPPGTRTLAVPTAPQEI